jgi:hypothetical protein
LEEKEWEIPHFLLHPRFLLCFVFSSVGDFELRAYTLSHTTSPLFETGSGGTILLGKAWNLDPPDLCLLSG